MKLIDADALRYMTVAECSGHSIEYAMGWKTCVDWIKIKMLPTVDAAPVVHGRWEERRKIKIIRCNTAIEREQKKILGYGGRTIVTNRCSVCGKVTMVDDSIIYSFCPHCGAKMDGGGDDAR